MKDKNHVINGIDKVQELGKIQHPFVIKSAQQNRQKMNGPKHNKGHV